MSDVREQMARLESEIKFLNQRLDDLRPVYHAELMEKYGVRTGCLVRYKGAQYKVHDVERTWGEAKPWLRGFKNLKDGNFSQHTTHLYSYWEAV